ncbi:MAG: S9 family peptidase [Bacteroidetes bacterium]|nr:S9 family peptidase [Bacteroidota bacterium]
MLRLFTYSFLSLMFFLTAALTAQENTFTSYDLLRMRFVVETSISPDGNFIAYTVHAPRQLTDKPGKHYRYLYLYDLANEKSMELLGDKVLISSIAWMPDSKSITFLAKLNDDKYIQVYQLMIDSGEPAAITNSFHNVLQYQMSKDGNQLAFVSTSVVSEEKQNLLENGFDAEIYEEEYLDRNLYLLNLKSQSMDPRQLTENVSVYNFRWSPDGKQIAAFIADKNLVDYSYMFKRVYLIDTFTGKRSLHLENPGKISQMEWSPDGKHIAFIAASGINDAVTGSLFITEVPNTNKFEELKNYANGLELSIRKVEWKDDNTVLFLSEEGVDISLSEQGIDNAERKMLINPGQIVFRSFDVNDDFISLAGNNSKHPSELYSFTIIDKKLAKLTDVNPWLQELNLAKQEKIIYNARDGLEIQATLIYPVDYEKGKKYPLICMIHGGPESALQNGWQTSYNRWGQIAAANGFFVFMPNYRAGSGRGVDFTMKGFGDTGGAEFTDVLDGIDYLVKQGLIDKKRVGIGGGSYGGYFSAWAATRFTDRFAAAVVFVGVTDQVSKRLTTDIPFEDYFVHWGFWTYENEDLVWARSPVRYVKDSKTPTLILGGKEDTRVYPSQSLELYRGLKVHGVAPVRLIRYPGEKHGNRKNTSRLDYSLRTMRWFNYYLNSDNPKDEMPNKYLEIELQ